MSLRIDSESNEGRQTTALTRKPLLCLDVPLTVPLSFEQQANLLLFCENIICIYLLGRKSDMESVVGNA